MTCQNAELSGKSLLGEKMESGLMQQSNAALSLGMWWEKPAANDGCALGGWYIESDPIGLRAGLNTYRYAYNNPLTWIDVFGLDETDWINTTGGRSVWDGPTNGNWGGKCWSGGSYSCNGNGMSPSRPPTDSADMCFMWHDTCFKNCEDKCGDDRKRCEKECNRRVIRCLRNLSDNPKDWTFPPRPGTETDSRKFRDRAIDLFGPGPYR